MNDLIEQLQAAIADIPQQFGEGDEIVASVTPELSLLLAETKKEGEEVIALQEQKKGLQKGINDLSTNIMTMAQETTQRFKPIAVKKSEYEE
ncbi:sialidase family protein, partial [Herbiconiux daphne]